MSVIDKYGALITRRIDGNPAGALRLLRLGLAYEGARLRVRPAGQTPRALVTLNRIAIRSVAGALKHPEKTVWVNLFAPVELLHSFGLIPLSIECFSSFMGGFRIEDRFLRHAENLGMSDTLCSYHKGFLGVADLGVLPKPLLSVTTSLACDCNVNTFRYIGEKLGVRGSVIDIPYEDSERNIAYVAGQLEQLIGTLEQAAGRRFDERELRRVIERENLSRELQEEALILQRDRDYPCTLTLHMFKLFATHLLSGTQAVLDYYRELADGLRRAPARDAARILWIHLLPYYQATLGSYFNYNPSYRVAASDFDIDYRGRLDPDRPLEALARKMINNIYNGPFDRKIRAVTALADELRPDGVIHFNHWGCKQSSGGVMEMKRAFDAKGTPFLILDGDGIDRRNDHDGQLRTRTEAFFEMLAQRKNTENAV
jgi:benzoyl-CoA reductase/2-hydroxyglutaryl-CoA dehydratase subunit BcrC/BadD/HgdB